MILGCGFADERKGFDLYLKSTLELMKKEQNIYAVWIGNFKENYSKEMYEKYVPKNIEKTFFSQGLLRIQKIIMQQQIYFH